MEPGRSGTSGPVAALASVLTPDFLHRLDRLHLCIRRSLSTRPGNTPMPRGAQGSGIEIESYKSYTAGDDLRHLDWNAYGRLDQLLIKTFRAEREAPLHIFLDVSGSMAFPPGDGKFAFGLALATSLAYLSLRSHNLVRLVAVGQALPGLYRSSRFFRHRDALPGLRDFLLELRPQGQTALAAGIRAALQVQRAPGVAIVLSDFLMPVPVYESALEGLMARRFTVAAVRIIGPGERNPTRLFRRGQLIDAETGRRRFISLTAEHLGCYQRGLAEHLGLLRAFCSRCATVFSVADTAAGLEQSLFHDLPSAGLLR
ncbi:MAG: DUF58 domain-containing protein [Candidatus Binatia bacterium]